MRTWEEQEAHRQQKIAYSRAMCIFCGLSMLAVLALDAIIRYFHAVAR